MIDNVVISSQPKPEQDGFERWSHPYRNKPGDKRN